jgi:hypothetical protein
VAEDGAKQSGEKRPEEPTYHRDRLVAEAEGFFGHRGHVVVAALSHAKVGNKQNFTRSQVEKMIERYSSHEVEFSHSADATEEES